MERRPFLTGNKLNTYQNERQMKMTIFAVLIISVIAPRGISAQEDILTNQKIVSFLTFQKGDAEQAMNFYVTLFNNSEIIELKRWGGEGPGKEGAIMHATFSLDGQLFMCSDSPAIHEWDFTPAVSNFVQCESEEELELLFDKLAEKGQVAMPLNNYGFSQKFGWVMDQFGISWQLNLE
jgi:predicted 3-demethylubiquinone-9 3-methyltransferase (glyoxalase superfamily)